MKQLSSTSNLSVDAQANQKYKIALDKRKAILKIQEKNKTICSIDFEDVIQEAISDESVSPKTLNIWAKKFQEMADMLNTFQQDINDLDEQI